MRVNILWYSRSQQLMLTKCCTFIVSVSEAMEADNRTMVVKQKKLSKSCAGILYFFFSKQSLQKDYNRFPL